MPTPISLILCTHNRAEDLRQTLASIAGLEIPEDLSVELILVNNGSDDHTLEVMQAFSMPCMSVRIVQEPRPGKARACNAGIRASSGRILLFTDDDVRVPRQWISSMCEPILKGTADAVAGEVILAHHLVKPWMRMPRATAPPGITKALSKDHPQRLVGASMSFARHVLETVPSFDTELGPGALGFEEETLFSLQLLQAGFTITSAFDSPVEHHLDATRLSRATFLSIAENLGRSTGYIDYHWRHLHKGTWRESSLRLCLSLAKGYFLLLFAHVASRIEWRYLFPQGVDCRETLALRRLYAIKQVMRERKRPHNYDQYGLVHRFHPGALETPSYTLEKRLHTLASR
ncbi:MAG TPA: glycosyltransferase family 2 protein [Rhodothermales bacterium]|nr:glycosyltransferase family 2 protein [Rhodothermales bacterium]